MAGPERPAEARREIRDRDGGGEARRIHLGERWQKDDVGADAAQLLDVGGFGPGIAVHVLARAELRRIHEDAHDRAPGAFAAGPHQREMALVQRPQRRDEREALPVCAKPSDGRPERGYVAHDHGMPGYAVLWIRNAHPRPTCRSYDVEIGGSYLFAAGRSSS